MNTVYLPERILNRNTGGNTTYTRAIAERLVSYGWAVDTIPAGRTPPLTAVRETAFGLRSLSGSVLHFSADTGPLLKPRTPSVVTVHGIASRWTPVARTPRQEAIWRGRVARAIELTDRVITVSKSSARDISAVFNIDESEVDVIPHGIDAAYFSETCHPSEALAEALPPRFALYLGNIEPRKNVAALVEAFASQDIPLVIAGRFAWNFEEAAAAIAASENVIHLGYVSDDDRRALMQSCTIFVFPSLYEGFGFPILEAMAAGAPVLCSASGSLAEVSGPARIFEGLAPDELAVGVREALADVAWLASAPEEGKAWADTFSWERSVAHHDAVYSTLLGL